MGWVKDTSSAGVEAALVQIADEDTGMTRTVNTDRSGRFAALEVPPGTYALTVLKGGFNTERRTGIRLGISQTAWVDDIILVVAPVGAEKVTSVGAKVSLLQTDTPTLGGTFSQGQIRQLPFSNRDVNALALLAPGVSSARTFSFASTLVPFAVSGSRGRNNNFIVDSVDNNEPLFGGAATQFTNTDSFSEFSIATSLYKAEYGRNSGSVVNLVTNRGANGWHGTAFWYGERDNFNALDTVEKAAGLPNSAPYRGDVFGATLGGPIQRNATWFFASYQWSEIRSDLSAVYPQVATLPTLNGLNALSAMPQTRTLEALLADPTVSTLPLANSPCVGFIPGLPATNPCSVTGGAANGIPVNGTPVEFGTYYVPDAGLFQYRDHQALIRIDHRLGPRDDLSGRYLFDDLRTTRNAGLPPIEVGFFDPGLFPLYGDLLAQRTQNAGIFWTHAWPKALHELRFSFSRIAADDGSLNASQNKRELLPSMTVSDAFALEPAAGGTPGGTNQLLSDFTAAGNLFTIGRDTRPTENHTTLYQIQDNVSVALGRHSIKWGVNFIETLSNLRSVPSDLGEYFYQSGSASGFQNFVNNAAQFAIQTFSNLGGKGGEELPLRQFSQFYFLQDDFRINRSLVISLGLRYENFGQPLNRLADLNPAFGPRIATDNLDFGPRVGFAQSLGTRTVLRGGYGMYYDPTVYNVALLAWQSGPISPFVIGSPSNVYPQPPFVPSDALRHVTDCDSLALSGSSTGPTFADCTASNTIATNLKQPRTHNFTLAAQREVARDLLFEAAYVGAVGTRLFQRVDVNPHLGYAACATPPCAYLPRIDPTRGDVFEVTNGADSTYHALQLSATKRAGTTTAFRGLSFTAAYTWSHWIDNASEIFGPEVRRVSSFKFLRKNAAPVEVITPFAQDYLNTTDGERGNSSYDRRHHLAVSFVWSLPSFGDQWVRSLSQGWQISGIYSAQSGSPFSPLNSFGACTDANGDGILTNDRPSIGNPKAPLNSVALVADPNCLSVAGTAQYPTGYKDPNGNPIAPATAHFVQVPLNTRSGTAFTANGSTFVAGNAGRNTLVGPFFSQLDFSVQKVIRLRERLLLKLRADGFDLLNSHNPGYPVGNPFFAETESAKAIAFGSVSPAATPARVTGLIPENSVDAIDSRTGQPAFLSRGYMNASSRRIQLSARFSF